MPIRAIRSSPNFALQPLPNGALLSDTAWNGYQNAQTQLTTRGQGQAHSGHYHNGLFKPMIGVAYRANSTNQASGFFLGESQSQIDLIVPPGYNRLWLSYQTRLFLFQSHANNSTILGSSIRIDLMQFQGGITLSRTDWRDNVANHPLNTRNIEQEFALDSIYRLSSRTELRLALRITYDTCEGVRDYDGQFPGQTMVPIFNDPTWWDGLAFLSYGLYRD